MEKEWKIPEESKEKEFEEEAELEEPEEELENVIQETPTSFIKRIDAEQVEPFLKQAPIEVIENLEEDLQDVPGQTQENEEEQPVLYNAPEYNSTYETGYEGMEKQTQRDPEMARGALIRREEDLGGIGEMQGRRMNFQKWPQANAERIPEQQEQYVGKIKRLEEQDRLPFQRKKRIF